MANRTTDEIARAWVEMVRGRFLEVPGLRLTRRQVEELWGLDPATCDSVLEWLIDARFLERTPGGAFVHANLIRH